MSLWDIQLDINESIIRIVDIFDSRLNVLELAVIGIIIWLTVISVYLFFRRK